ncbi:protein kinase [Achlya hypogyna]|uniref:Protein kinase n=1 Tax=Achlya hypogyna TaxID=1202772 RepID=A0A1V9YIV1_ACHHY|nr:protein kinase [Achlya hypogyna]
MTVVFFDATAATDDVATDSDDELHETPVASGPQRLRSRAAFNGFPNPPRLNPCRLQSLHVVALRAVLRREGPRPKVLLEWLPGGSARDALNALLEGRSPAVPFDTLRVAVDVATALADLHAHGVVHRDVRAGAVLLAADGRAKLDCAGLADARAPLEHGVGSLCWAAPEVLTGGGGGSPADIYAFGVFLTELVTRQKPFAAAQLHVWELLEGVRNGTLRPAVGDACEHWYRELPEACLSFHPAARPTADQVLRCLMQHAK